jgi:putative ABC transport system permease protein
MFKLILNEAWLSIVSHKLRSFLTTLGIIIGVCAVVMMVAAGQTVTNIINDTFSSMGSNLLIIHPGTSTQGGIRTGRGRSTISLDDIKAINRTKDVAAAAPIINASAQAVYNAHNWNVSITGTTPDYMEVANWEIETGVGLTDKDIQSATDSILIGQTVITELFGFEDPIGKTLRLKNIPFRVVGTLKGKGQGLMGNDQDNIVIMPVSTIRRKIVGSNRPKMVDLGFVKVASEDKMDIVNNRIEQLIRSRHKLKDKQPSDFGIRDLTEMVNNVKLAGLVLSILLAAIASISLIVGSIGIMNMMLVAVTERTREIGIRKSLGAPNRWIMIQFLMESVLISFLGSLIGLMFGIGFSQLAGYILEQSVPITLWPIILSFSVALVVGISSGLFPAIKAMKLDPIEALRYQ